MDHEFAHRRVWGPTPRYDLVKEFVPRDPKFIVIAGPCSVESPNQIRTMAEIVADHGATHLRGGVFRAGTYPGSSFGLVEEELIAIYAEAAHKNGLKCIIEVLDYSPTALHLATKYADCLQVGCRQMQNYTLLRKVAEFGKPVFLKRNPGATIDEWLGAAEHILAAGKGFAEPILIERGSSTNARHVRWDLSISIIPAVKAITKMQVICDASHGTGRRDLVEPMTLAGVAAGAAGILVECHMDPEKSLSDADQAVDPQTFARIMRRVEKIRGVL